MPYVEYELNKKYIAEFLCENKKKPEMKCNGRCHLKKQLKKVNDEEKKLPVPPLKIEKLTISLFCSNIKAVNFTIAEGTKTPYIENYQFIFNGRIFHPPKSRTSYIQNS
jgi:hypothetical protein